MKQNVGNGLMKQNVGNDFMKQIINILLHNVVTEFFYDMKFCHYIKLNKDRLLGINSQHSKHLNVPYILQGALKLCVNRAALGYSYKNLGFLYLYSNLQYVTNVSNSKGICANRQHERYPGISYLFIKQFLRFFAILLV